MNDTELREKLTKALADFQDYAKRRIESKRESVKRALDDLGDNTAFGAAQKSLLALQDDAYADGYEEALQSMRGWINSIMAG